MNEPAKQPLELPSATYEPQLSASIDLERYLSSEVLLHVFDLSGTHEVKTCCGDVVKIVNALRDYAKLLELVLEEPQRNEREWLIGKSRELRNTEG